MTRPIITLTTDFGTRDSYVGVVKGVIIGFCPDAHIVDITHEIPPQDIVSAAATVQTFEPYFPPGTIHVVVVDPGVGSARRAIAIETPMARYVGPDNGLFGAVWQAALARWSPAQVRAVALTEPRFWRSSISSTFHGRDIFAPVAAHLARGVDLEQFGPRIDDPVLLMLSEPVWVSKTMLLGKIVGIDHFGNCISNISVRHLDQLGPLQELHVQVNNRMVASIQRTYADVEPGEVLALLDSNDVLEWAIRNGNASYTFGIGPGEIVQVERVDSVTHPNDAASVQPAPPPLPDATPQLRAGSHVLVADDDPDICRTLKSLLELEGYSVEVVYNGAGAVERLKHERFDMLITDLSMPDTDGLTLIKHCQERGLDLTMIIVTGHASLQSAVQALQLGAYDYVLKPFDAPVLLAAVARAAERQHLRRELEQRKHLEMVSRLAFTVRHEINNPLSAILGLAQLHLEEPLTDELRSDLETISRSAQRISDALQRLTQLRKLLFTDTGIGDGSTMLAL